MPPCRHVCLVDTDRNRRLALSSDLERRAITVTPLAQAGDLLRMLPQCRPDLAVLATRLPDLDGLEACRHLRAGGDRLPLILITGTDDEVERIVGLELGADDCLGPRVSGRELRARVEAVLRRCHPSPTPAREDGPVAVGEWTFHVATRCLRRGAQTRALRAVEHALLAALTAHPGQVLARERLLCQWPARPDAVLARSVDAAVMRLRRLVEPNPAEPRHIRTVRGHG